ncbi:BnaA05g14780D [Brassica napus]|uniref:BnaA05g14780D protein n=1 Tax=Brassica napus TaxID=3708 RepID=A0A078GL56_BRANA|nr:BnaA05g14780D [Brassica napus]
MSSIVELSSLEELTLNAEQIQDDLLEKILRLNSNTEYLRRFLHGSNDKELFKKNVPLANYEDVKPYIERVANGEPSDLISGGPVTRFFRSSGTSGGKQKIFPVNDEAIEQLGYVLALRSLVMSKHFSDNGVEQGKTMEFHYTKPESTTPSGLPVAAAFTNEVVRFGATFAHALVRAIDFLESNWKELCGNIRLGHVSEWITDLGCRSSVSAIIGGPNPELADLIEQECSHKSWEGIVTRLWPKAKRIECVLTGQMAQYIPILDFYCNKLPLVSTVYGSSESIFGFNVDPLCKPQDVSYTFVPNTSYFEFLPVDHEGDMTSIVDLVNVKLGCYYEPVVTTCFGLNRYLIGDILEVTGFYNNTPQFRFVRRKNMVLSVETETTTEDDILKALARATFVLESSNLMLMDFTSSADISTFPGHYVFYWELKGKEVNDVLVLDEKTLMGCCYVLEESFGSTYRLKRRTGLIGALEIRVVEQGTFNSLTDYFISRGSSRAQYKTPLCINSSEASAVLENKVLARFHSEKSPPLDL